VTRLQKYFAVNISVQEKSIAHMQSKTFKTFPVQLREPVHKISMTYGMVHKSSLANASDSPNRKDLIGSVAAE
jgi:hypothetical protein